MVKNIYHVENDYEAKAAYLGERTEVPAFIRNNTYYTDELATLFASDNLGCWILTDEDEKVVSYCAYGSAWMCNSELYLQDMIRDEETKEISFWSSLVNYSNLDRCITLEEEHVSCTYDTQDLWDAMDGKKPGSVIEEVDKMFENLFRKAGL